MGHGKSSDPNIFILPDLGEGVHEAEMISWKVEVGQTVAEHEILAEMETDKALVEVPSPRAGTIAELHGSEGEVLNVGNVLVTYGDGAAAAASAAKSEPAPTATEAEVKPAAESGSGEREDDGTVVGNMSGAAAGITAEAGKVLAAPAVRRLARDMGVDQNPVQGPGLAGRVAAQDVRAAAAGDDMVSLFDWMTLTAAAVEPLAARVCLTSRCAPGGRLRPSRVTNGSAQYRSRAAGPATRRSTAR